MSGVSILEVEVAPGVLRWELCRPQRRNPVDPAALDFIAARCGELRGEVVVVTGRGDEAFCAGFDLDALASHDDPSQPPDAPLIAATAAMQAADATFVARLGGYAIGAGVELCCACDLRVARHGVHFSIPAHRLGVVYHAAGVRRFERVFGPALTRSLLLLGRRITAEQADRAGAFIDFVAPEELDAAVEAVVADLRAGNRGALAGHRTLLRELDAPPLDDAGLDAHERRRDEAYRRMDAAKARRILRGDSD